MRAADLGLCDSKLHSVVNSLIPPCHFGPWLRMEMYTCHGAVYLNVSARTYYTPTLPTPSPDAARCQRHRRHPDDDTRKKGVLGFHSVCLFICLLYTVPPYSISRRCTTPSSGAEGGQGWRAPRGRTQFSLRLFVFFLDFSFVCLGDISAIL